VRRREAALAKSMSNYFLDRAINEERFVNNGRMTLRLRALLEEKALREADPFRGY